MNESLLTVEEIAEYLKLNPRTVYRLLKRGEIPAYRIANQFRFDRAMIQRWLDDRRVDSDREVA